MGELGLEEGENLRDVSEMGPQPIEIECGAGRTRKQCF